MKPKPRPPDTPASGRTAPPATSTLRARLNARTHELAELAGRRAPFVTQRDYERAKQDVTGETDHARQDAILDAPTEKGHSCPQQHA